MTSKDPEEKKTIDRKSLTITPLPITITMILNGRVLYDGKAMLRTRATLAAALRRLLRWRLGGVDTFQRDIVHEARMVQRRRGTIADKIEALKRLRNLSITHGDYGTAAIIDRQVEALLRAMFEREAQDRPPDPQN